jgi:nucleotide-binding universal stress UspA family protein
MVSLTPQNDLLVDQEQTGNPYYKILEAEKLGNIFLPIRRVLVAVDLSDSSEATASYAAEIASCFAASLRIVYVYEPVPLCEYASETTNTVLEEQRVDLQKMLEQLARKLQTSSLICTSAFLVGEPAEQTAALARDIDADLIVTASHHPTFLARLFHMDKASLIMHRAPCPVLIYNLKNRLQAAPCHRNFGVVRGAEQPEMVRMKPK